MADKEVTVEDLELELMELEDQYSKTRNAVDKGELVDKIKSLKEKIAKESNGLPEQKVIDQNDNAPRMDHKEAREITRGSIFNAGSAFVTTI